MCGKAISEDIKHLWDRLQTDITQQDFQSIMQSLMENLAHMARLADGLGLDSMEQLHEASIRYATMARIEYHSRSYAKYTGQVMKELNDEKSLLVKALRALLLEVKEMSEEQLEERKKKRQTMCANKPPPVLVTLLGCGRREWDVNAVICAQRIARKWLNRRRFAKTVKMYVSSATKRMNLVRELVATEKGYCDYLAIAVLHFFEPLKREPEIININDLNLIFANLHSIWILSVEMSSQLQKRLDQWPTVQTFGDLFIKLAPMMKLYTEYVINYTARQEVLAAYKKRKSFAAFLKRYAEQTNNTLSLSDLLIMPIQRIPRYELILKQIIDCTPPSHEDYANLNNALETVREVANHLNKRRGEYENTTKMLELLKKISGITQQDLYAKDRVYIREDTFDVFSLSSRECIRTDARQPDALCVLCSDLVIIARKGKMVTMLHLPNCTLTDINVPGQIAFKLSNKEKGEFVFTTSNPKAKEFWMLELPSKVSEISPKRP